MSIAVAAGSAGPAAHDDAGARPRTAHDVGVIVALHVALVAGLAVGAGLPAPARGWGFLVVAIAYAVALPVLARRLGRADWLALWAFLLPVSVCQVLPDWFLADVLGTLRFPDAGGPRVDDVIPVAMAGLWLPPLFVALAVAGRSPLIAGAVALVLFAGAELLAPTSGLWEPAGDTARGAGVALYVLPAEAALGWAAATAMMAVGGAGRARRWAAALAVSTFYLGALVLCHFLVDVAGFRITV
jgi:hypothetical protein